MVLHSPQSSTRMERIFLCLLCLSGWSVSSCLPRQYHYVDDPKTWTEAQTYCRKTYTDLATVQNTEEMDQLKSSVPSDHPNDSVWIGLYSNIQWKWSDGYKGSGSDYRNWDNIRYSEPDFYAGLQFCATVDDKGRWFDSDCQDYLPSICNRGTQQDPDFVFVSEEMTWSSAQRYCRENYVDLATVKNDTETQKIQSLIPSGSETWIGLYRDPNMFWSDGSGYSFHFWGDYPHVLGSLSVVCGAAYVPHSGNWETQNCDSTYPFMCYSSDKKIQRQVIKLRIKPDDPSLDLNDPAVKAGLLRELQDRLKASGLSGVTLKWREQPDGKVFHKEGESSQEKDRKKSEL